MYKLYKHQSKQNKIVKKMLKEDRHVIYGAPTGYGKSVAMTDLIDTFVSKGKRVLILAPSITLVNQLYSGLIKHSPKVSRGDDTRGHNNRNPSVQITSLQTANSRLKSDDNFYGHIDVILWDEVHVSGDIKEGKIGAQVKLLIGRYWDEAKWIGFSATPMTAKWKQLSGWDNTSYLYNTKWLIANGFLSHFKYHGTTNTLIKDEDKKVASTGDYKMDVAGKALSQPSSIDAFMNSYKLHKGLEKKTLVFCATIEHAKLLQVEVIGSKLIHSKMSEREQLEVLEWFESKPMATLFNVSILTTGFDDPTVNLIILARPIRTVRLAIQIWGRGLRKLGDKICHIVDLCEVYKDCGLPIDERKYTDKANSTTGDPIYRCCDVCEGVELSGRWTYIRDVDNITSVCPIEGCKVTVPNIPYVEGYDVVIEDSEAFIKREKIEAEKRVEREKAQAKQRVKDEKRANKKRKKLKRKLKKVDDFTDATAVAMVKTLISKSSHYSNANYAYYLVKDVIKNNYGKDMNKLLKQYVIGEEFHGSVLSKIVKWSK